MYVPGFVCSLTNSPASTPVSQVDNLEQVIAELTTHRLEPCEEPIRSALKVVHLAN